MFRQILELFATILAFLGIQHLVTVAGFHVSLQVAFVIRRVIAFRTLVLRAVHGTVVMLNASAGAA